MLLEQQIKSLLLEIGANAFPGVTVPYFSVRLENTNPKSKLGHYHPLKKEIVVFHLNRDVRAISKTSIHELAHHYDRSVNGKTGHSAAFYKTYKTLLEAAIFFGYFSYEEIDEGLHWDIQKLEKRVGPIRRDVKTIVKDPNTYYVKVTNCFDIKDQLREIGFKWDGLQQIWWMICSKQKAEDMAEILASMTKKQNITLQPSTEIILEKIVYLKIANAFDIRDNLKEKGFFFRKIGFVALWVKKVKHTDLQTILDSIKTLTKPENITVTDNL